MNTGNTEIIFFTNGKIDCNVFVTINVVFSKPISCGI